METLIFKTSATCYEPNSFGNFMEEFAKSCGFILTCNYKDKIISPLHSRCSIVDFTHSKEDKSQMVAQFFKQFYS